MPEVTPIPKPPPREKKAAKGLKRTGRLKPMSDKRRADIPVRADVREAVFKRDGRQCQAKGMKGAGRCYGDNTFHHIQKASALGEYTIANGLTLCARHNTLVEDDPGWAERSGLVKRRPVRIQMSRAKGWRKPPGVLYVGRPSQWGNPWKAGDPHPIFGWPMSVDEVVYLYRMVLSANPLLVRAQLRGLDLACWCKLGTPCHADVLLAVANHGG